MSAAETIRALLEGADQAASEERRAKARLTARTAWVKTAITAMKAAQERADEAWQRLFAALPEDMDDAEVDALPPPPEQAELDALWAEMAAVRDHARWPRHLHWGDV